MGARHTAPSRFPRRRGLLRRSPREASSAGIGRLSAHAFELMRRRHALRVARDDATLRAIFRLRFEAVADQRLALDVMPGEPERRLLFDAHDRCPSAMHVCAEDRGRISGAVRVRCWRGGLVPEAVAQRYRFDALVGIERMTVAEVSWLAVAAADRVSDLSLALIAEAGERAVRYQGAQVVMVSGGPEQVRSARQLGFRPVGAPRGSDLGAPMMYVVGDTERGRRSGALWQLGLERARRLGRVPTAGARTLSAAIDRVGPQRPPSQASPSPQPSSTP